MTTKIQIKVKQHEGMNEKKTINKIFFFRSDVLICKEMLPKKQHLKIFEIEMEKHDKSYSKAGKSERCCMHQNALLFDAKQKLIQATLVPNMTQTTTKVRVVLS